MNKTLCFFLLSLSALPAFGQSASKALMDMVDRIDQLKSEIQQLRGDAERFRNDLDRIQERQQSLYLDLDKRLLNLEGKATGSTPPRIDGAAGSAKSVEPPVPPERSVAPLDTGSGVEPSTQEPNDPDVAQQENIYQEAFVFLNNGRYDEAIAGFSRLIETYPGTEYADNAQYWLGETYYVKRDFTAARDNFNQVMEKYPDSNKVPDALLKLGYIEYELSEWKRAREIFNSVIQKYPGSNAAQLAQNRLDRMRGERH